MRVAKAFEADGELKASADSFGHARVRQREVLSAESHPDCRIERHRKWNKAAARIPDTSGEAPTSAPRLNQGRVLHPRRLPLSGPSLRCPCPSLQSWIFSRPVFVRDLLCGQSDVNTKSNVGKSRQIADVASNPIARIVWRRCNLVLQTWLEPGTTVDCVRAPINFTPSMPVPHQTVTPDSQKVQGLSTSAH